VSRGVNTGSLVLRIGEETVTIRDYFTEHGYIEKIVFADGTVWHLEEVLKVLGEYVPPNSQPEPSIGETFRGTVYNDYLIGTAFSDIFYASTGDDFLSGGGGSDTYYWGRGFGSDIIADFGVDGTNTVYIDAKASEVTVNRAQVPTALEIRLDGAVLSITDFFNVKSDGHQEVPMTVVFSDGTIWSLAEVLEILGAPSQPVESKTPDSEDESPETEGVHQNGGKGNDVLRGHDGADTLSGGAGADKLFGNKGDDVLLGGQGRDLLTGGDGADVFAFSKTDTVPGKARDVINDFNHGTDKVDLSALDANKGLKGNNAFHSLLKGKTSFTEAGQIRYDAKTGILSVNTDKDAQVEFEILLKNKPKVLTLSDFIL
jgi:Ca2+-binding RTX toxin-like protein